MMVVVPEVVLHHRRLSDRSWWVQAWYGFPLSDPVSGAWSFTRTASAAFIAAEIHVLLERNFNFGSAPNSACYVALVALTLAYALGGKTFEAIALGALGRFTKTETRSDVHTETTVVEKPVQPENRG